MLLFTLFPGSGRVGAQETPVPPAAGRPVITVGKPLVMKLESAGSTRLDLRNIGPQKPRKHERPELDPPPLNPIELPGGLIPDPNPQLTPVPGPSAPAPSPIANFAGLDLSTWGSGWPPDTVGDVGPVHYIQSVNSSVGIYDKSTAVRIAAFTLDAFFSLGSFGNLCDTDNFGDPVVLYDSFEDRWVISDFAFQLNGANDVINPPGAFECIAVSMTGDPVSGGWNYYFLNLTDGLNDYPKLGIWPDGIYMSANMFDFSTSAFQGVRVWALNKIQMYAGDPSIQVVQFEAPAGEFSLLPANARLQTGTPPEGTPNYFSTVWQFSNAISFYKFQVDWDRISLSTFAGPFISIAPASWSDPPNNVPVMGGSDLDTLPVRLMMQNQYTNISGVESLWNSHTVGGSAAGMAAPRYYQVVVTGGAIAANTAQAATHTPDTTVDRYMPSLAVNRAGDMAMGYSASSSSLFPAIRYAGRLSSDAVNTLPQTETSLVEGTGAQNYTSRWGDYSAMTLDPDGCTFWYTNEYYLSTGSNWQTRIGSFKYPGCSPVFSGTVQGTVTATAGGAAISGATVSLGSRTMTTNGSGFYQFPVIPSGTYPDLAVTAPGFDPKSFNAVVVTDSATTTRDFSLETTAASACPIDTSQADFQLGVPTDTDLTTSAGSVTLGPLNAVDQQNTDFSNSGYSFSSTSWAGQTFTAGVSGKLTAVDVFLFCSNCTGTTPDLTLSIRATASDLPAGSDLATGTITGFSTGAGGFFKVSFATPPDIVSGTSYAIVVRANANPGAGTYAYVNSHNSPYSDGRRVTSSDSGNSWTGERTDLGFHVYVNSGFVGSGNLVSSLKDSNPATGNNPTWTTLSWSGLKPANTTLRFQVAGSNDASGPFDFVGPDGSASTFFTSSGASLSQFDGNRYLKYKALLSTTNAGASPTLNDVTTCYSTNSVPSADVSISKTDGVSVAVPGGLVTYTLVAGNAGPSDAVGASVSDTFPASLSCSWTCVAAGGASCAASGSGDISDTVTLPVAGTATYSAVCDIAADATGSLINTASISFAGDENTDNNSATDTDTLLTNAVFADGFEE